MRELKSEEIGLVCAGTMEGRIQALRTCEGFPDGATVTVGKTLGSNVEGDAKFIAGGATAEVSNSISVTCGELRGREGSGGGGSNGRTTNGQGMGGVPTARPKVIVGPTTKDR